MSGRAAAAAITDNQTQTLSPSRDPGLASIDACVSLDFVESRSYVFLGGGGGGNVLYQQGAFELPQTFWYWRTSSILLQRSFWMLLEFLVPLNFNWLSPLLRFLHLHTFHVRLPPTAVRMHVGMGITTTAGWMAIKPTSLRPRLREAEAFMQWMQPSHTEFYPTHTRMRHSDLFVLVRINTTASNESIGPMCQTMGLFIWNQAHECTTDSADMLNVK